MHVVGTDRQLELIGRVESLGVYVFCDMIGMDTLPFPFTLRVTGRDPDEVATRKARIRTHLDSHPPEHLRQWIRASYEPDISMHLYGLFGSADDATIRSIRVNAVRRGEDGFVAVQDTRTTEFADIAVYRTDATLLGPAILEFTPAKSAGMLGELEVRPPQRSESRRTGSLLERNDSSDDGLRAKYLGAATEFSASAYVTPFRLRDWDVQEDTMTINWVQKANDGQYLLRKTDGTRAVPADRSRLKREINLNVAKAVQIVREHRAGDSTS